MDIFRETKMTDVSDDKAGICIGMGLPTFISIYSLSIFRNIAIKVSVSRRSIYLYSHVRTNSIRAFMARRSIVVCL